MLETFTSRHGNDLQWYFSGGPAGDCGLRSSCGAQLEAIAATAQSDLTRAPEWDGRTRYDEAGAMVPLPGQVRLCRPSRSGASPDSTEAAAEALAAVRRERIVRAALSGVHPIEARALAEYYAARPEGSHTGLEALGELRGVVAYLVDDVRDVARRAAQKKTAENGTERAEAKAALRRYVAQARALVATARASYAVAAGVAVRVERERRAARFAGGGA